MSTKRLLCSALLVCLVRIGHCQETESVQQGADQITLPPIKVLYYGFDLLDIRHGIKGKIGAELSATFQSKHIWHGFDLLDDHGIFIPVATVTLGDTGLSGKVIGIYPLSSGFENSVELDFGIFYTAALLQDTHYVTNLTGNYFYYGKPNVGGRKADAQEIGVSFSWPQLLGVDSLIPNYYVGCLWPSRSNSNISGCGGFIHIFGLAYDLAVPDFGPIGQEQKLRLSGDITYNDGFGGVDHDWSHAVLGASTNLGNDNITIMPYVNYQISMDDSVNNEDEIWCGVTSTYRFR